MLAAKDHNNPPEVLELASGVVADISAYMADNPVVEDEDSARGMKTHIDRAKLCIKDLESERDGKVRPLNDKVAYINSRYKAPRTMMGDLLDEMLSRVQVFVKAESARRQKIADALAAQAREAERLAREAERIEREKLDDAAKGEVGINVAEVIAKADEAFEDFTRLEREAILAKKDTHVKVGGGFSRAIGLKEKETLHIVDAILVIKTMGVTPDMELAILKSARAYRKVHGKLPGGITSTVEKEL